jgi:hypothetical protein
MSKSDHYHADDDQARYRMRMNLFRNGAVGLIRYGRGAGVGRTRGTGVCLAAVGVGVDGW